MSFFLIEDRSAYRKWVNVVTSMLLPGSAHFLSGRRRAGILWFIANLIGWSVWMFLYPSPFQSIISLGIAFLIHFVLRVVIVLDSCRKFVPRRNFGDWATVGILLVVWYTLPSLFVRTFVWRSLYIPTASMAPTLMGNRKASDGHVIEGDHIIINEWQYRVSAPQRGDLIVFRTEAIGETERERFRIPSNEIYVKRLVGLPGEHVSIQPPSIYINGQKLVEPNIFENFFIQTNTLPELPVTFFGNRTNIQLGTDEYYVIGDNIMNSLDSRYYGAIKGGRFIGKVVRIVWPSEREGLVQ